VEKNPAGRLSSRVGRELETDCAHVVFHGHDGLADGTGSIQRLVVSVVIRRRVREVGYGDVRKYCSAHAQRDRGEA
jgi:hypothetical protein